MISIKAGASLYFCFCKFSKRWGCWRVQGVCRVVYLLLLLTGLSCPSSSDQQPLCHSELGAGHGGWSLVHKAWGTKRLPCPGAPRSPAALWHRLPPAALRLELCTGSSARAKSPRPAAAPREGGNSWTVTEPGVCYSCCAQPGGGGVCIVKCEPLAGGWPCTGHAGGWVLHTYASAGPQV